MSSSSASLLLRLLRIFRKLETEDSPPSGKGWFSAPVDIVALNIPDYPSIVKAPMDLGTIGHKYESGKYESISSMAADVLLTFDNALLYNGPESVVGAEAQRLKNYFLKHYEKLAAEIGESVPGSASSAAAGAAPVTAAAVAANAASKKGGASSSAAAASSSNAAASSSSSKEWVAPDLAITDATRPRIVGIVGELIAEPVSELFRTRMPDSETKYHQIIKTPMDLTTIKAALFKKSLRSVAEVDQHIELIHSNAMQYNTGDDKGAKSIRKDADQLRKEWRNKIKAFANKVAKDGATAGSSAAAASSSGATAHAADADQTDSEDESTPAARAAKGGKKSALASGAKANKKSSAQREALSTLFSSLLTALSAKALGFFQYPVDKTKYPEYYEDIARPISLDEIGTALNQGKYDSNPARFVDDVALVWENACSYNLDGSEVHTVAVQARKKWEKILEANKDIKELDRARNRAGAESTSSSKAEKAEKTAGSKKKTKATAAAPSSAATASSSSSSSAAAAATAPAQLPPVPPPAPVDLSGGALSLSKCRQVLTKLKLHHPDLLHWFMAPVSDLDVPKYSLKVKKPMCVEWIHDKLNKGTYASNQAFAEDGEQIWKNCVVFNGPDAAITKSAMTLRTEFRRLFAIEFGVPTLTAHMEMVEEAHRVAEERWKLECKMAEVMGTAKPRPPVPPPKPITVPKASATPAAAVPAAAVAAAATPAAASTPPKAAAPAASIKTEAPSAKLPPTVAPAAPAAAAPAAPAPAVKIEQKAPATAAAAAPAPTAVAPAASAISVASATPSPSPAPASSANSLLSIAPDPAFYTPERVAELSADLDPTIALNHLVQKLLREDIHDYFRRPVTITDDIADYVVKIPRPMDLGTLKKNMLAGVYPTYKALCDDIELIWGNAIGYNGPTHAVSSAAAFMRRKAHNYTLEMLAAHAHAEANKDKMPDALRKHAMALFQSLLKTASYAASFTAPIEDTPNFEYYKSKVARPISLGEARRKLEENSYHSLDEFLDDVRLCLRNAIEFYSRPETPDLHRIWSLQAQFLLNEWEVKVQELEHKLITQPGAGAKGQKGSKLKNILVLPPSARKSTTGGSAAGATDAQGDTPMGSADGAAPASSPSPSVPSFPLQTLSAEDLKKCTVVLDALSAETSGFTSFTAPVDPSMYAGLMDYFRVIDTPMDLSLIGRKLKIGRYGTTEDFCTDVDRITENVIKYYGQAHPEFPDGQALIAVALALRAQFKTLWDNYAKGVNLKKIAAAAAASGLTLAAAQPNSNLTPPTFAKNYSVAPLSPMRGGEPVSTAAAAGGLKEKEPLVYDPASIPAGMSVAEYEHALRKEMKRKRKEKKEEKRKRKREEGGDGGEVDVMKLSPPGSPDLSAEPPSAAHAAAAASILSPMPHAKMQRVAPLSGSGAAADTSSPRRIAGPSSSAAPAPAAPAPTKIKMKLGGETAATQLYQPTPEMPRVHISVAQRRKLLELAAAKSQAAAAPVTAAVAPSTSAAASVLLPEAPAVGSFRNANDDRSGDGMFDVPADSSVLPASVPGAPVAPAASPSPSPPPIVRALPLSMPPMQRAYSHLTPLLALQPQRGAKKSKAGKDKGKKAKKQKAMMAQLASYQEQVAAQRARRNAGQTLLSSTQKPSMSQHLTVLPTRISASNVPAYLRNDFSRLSSDPRVLVRVVHSTLPPTALFPFPIDQHCIVAAQVVDEDEDGAGSLVSPVEIQLQLSDAVSMQHSAAAQADIFDPWITIKAAIDETRGLKSVQRTDLALMEHPLTSSHLSDDLSFFASLSPSLQWHSGAACYTHSIEFTADQSASQLDDPAASAAPPAALTPLSFERVLELSLLADSSDSESDDDDEGERTHARPFFGALKTSCRMAGCVVTKAAGGGFYHRCPARSSLLAAHAAGSSSSSTAAAQAVVSCRGVVVWSLPDSLFLRVGGREFGATPFGGREGLWKERASIEEEKRQRIERMRAAQSRHEEQAKQAPMELSSILSTIKPNPASNQVAVSMSD